MSTKADQLYERVMNVVEESQRLINAPKVPDMSHIQAEVETLIKEINELPVEERITYEDRFKELFGALTVLEGGLRGKRDEINELLSDTDQHQKATNAYAKTSYIDKKDN